MCNVFKDLEELERVGRGELFMSDAHIAFYANCIQRRDQLGGVDNVIGFISVEVADWQWGQCRLPNLFVDFVRRFSPEKLPADSKLRGLSLEFPYQLPEGYTWFCGMPCCIVRELKGVLLHSRREFRMFHIRQELDHIQTSAALAWGAEFDHYRAECPEFQKWLIESLPITPSSPVSDPNTSG
jgi:hypothetical protein